MGLAREISTCHNCQNPAKNFIRVATCESDGKKKWYQPEDPQFKVSLGVFPTSSSQEVLSSCKCPPLPSQSPGLVPSLPGLSASEPPQPLDPYPARGDYKSRRAQRARPAALGLGAWRPASSVRGKASRRRPCGEVSDPLVLRARWERARLPPLSRMEGNEESHNKNRPALPRLCCVSGAPTACCTPERGICHPGVELGAEACPAPRRAAAHRGLRSRARRMGPGGGTARLGAQRAPHPPTPFPKTSSPGESPVSRTNGFFWKVLARNFPLCHQCHKRVVWLSDGTGWSKRLSGISSAALCSAPTAPSPGPP